jgi:hypothetical protein
MLSDIYVNGRVFVALVEAQFPAGLSIIENDMDDDLNTRGFFRSGRDG